MNMETDAQYKQLCETYAEKSDGELLDLDERREDLTELAQEALAKAMKDRGLEAAKQEEVGPAAPGWSEDEDSRDSLEIGEDEEPLYLFGDGLQARAAVGAMVDGEIAYRIIERPSEGPYGRPGGLLMVVKAEDVVEAQTLLRAKIGLFPLPEGDDAFEELVGWEPVGEFAKEDGLVVARALADNGFSYIWDDYEEGSVGPDPNVQISVRAERVKKALKVVEAVADGLPER
ncbi:MAG: hypothetical protein V4555_21270 [Acidobacteriota bacterium]